MLPTLLYYSNIFMCICWCLYHSYLAQCTVTIYLKLINTHQAKGTYAYNNTNEKQHTMFII